MKLLVHLLVTFTFGAPLAAAAETSAFDSVRAADQQRIASTVAAETLKLAQLLSDDLRYEHSDGRVQTKAQFIDAVATNTAKYLSVEPYDVTLQSIVPGAVAMHGRTRIAVIVETQRRDFALRFLAVWREEGGRWRLLAYQSSPLAAAPATAR